MASALHDTEVDMTQHQTPNAIASLIVALTLVTSAASAARQDSPRAAPLESLDTMALQVALDRAGVSPGVIDGAPGTNTRAAVTLFQRAAGLPLTGEPDVPTRDALRVGDRPTVAVEITAADAGGPFTPSIPADLAQQGALEALRYTSIVELLAERFHTTPALLHRLNPLARFAAGETIDVPNVQPLTLPPPATRRDAPGVHAGQTGTVVVTKGSGQLVVLDADGRLLFAAPVTTGSEHDPLPLGEWRVTDVYLMPVFHYNPALFWDADPAHAQTVIKPGPNNPVGVLWIDLNREHYGLHGTPEPSSVGRSTSHGCVRLTNWDALRLAEFVAPRTRVVFADQFPQVTAWPSRAP